MSTFSNTIYPKIQGTLSFRNSKQINQDENYIKITKGNKKNTPANEYLTNREFGKIIPYIINENTNPNISSMKVNDNKENLSKKILIDKKNINIAKIKQNFKEDPINNKIKLKIYNPRISQKTFQTFPEVKKESIIPTSNKNQNFNEEQKPKNQTFFQNSTKRHIQKSQNKSKNSNFSNIAMTDTNKNSGNNSPLENSNSTQVGNFTNNFEQTSNFEIYDKEKMIIDETIVSSSQNSINIQQIKNSANPIFIKKENKNATNNIIQVQLFKDNKENLQKISSPKEVNSKKNTLNPEDLFTGNPHILNPQPQFVDEYLDDIFQHLKEIEFNNPVNPFYMRSQVDINEKMRSILIDWLVEVHLKFKLKPETLFLTVNLVDRYLSKKMIKRNKLQLVGVTSMLIACKYEEIYAPEVRDFVYITDKAYTKSDIFAMENDILFTLEFNVTVPSSFSYLEVFNRYLKIEENSIMFCRYLLELFLIEYKMIKYNPSLLAASTMYIIMKITKNKNIQKVTELIGYTEDILKECSKDICTVMDNVEQNSLQAIRNKFSLPRFMEIAKIKFN